MDKETWYDIPDYEGYFQVSNNLIFRSLYGWNKGGLFKRKKPFIIKPVVCKNPGYYTFGVGFKGFGNKKRLYVHKVVATLFIPNPNNYRCVNHKNGIKTDNRIENLEWCTHKENTTHALKTGLIKILVGQQQSNVVLTDSEVMEIFITKGKYTELGRKYGVNPNTIKAIKVGRCWNHLTGLAKRDSL